MTKEEKLQNVTAKCIKNLQDIGIQTGNILSVTINTRAKKRWGQCKKDSIGSYRITINDILLAPTTSIAALEDTIYHELLHTCNGCFNHGKAWKTLAEKVNRAYGTNIKRCTDPSEKGLDGIRMENSKYCFRCKGCGQMVYRQRMSDFVKHYGNYKCGICGNKFERLR